MKKEHIDDQIRSLIGEKEFREYKNFALRDDMFKMAIGVMLGNSFNKVVYGMSDYLVMPVFTFLVSRTGNEWRNWVFTPVNGLTLEFGRLIGTFIDFIMVSILLYLFYIKIIGKVFRGNEKRPEMKQCPFCCGSIPKNAVKCPLCTGDLVVKPRRTRTKNTRTKNGRGK